MTLINGVVLLLIGLISSLTLLISGYKDLKKMKNNCS